jgi:hypothetical protein
MNDEIIATIDANGPRRFVGVGMLLMLGGLLLYIAFARPPESMGWQALLVAFGAFALWFAQKLQVATTKKLLLTKDALVDSDGSVLTRIEDVAAVERGMFAIKPSNGFMLKLKTPAPREWHPGLWWRLGRRLAVGGVTPGSQTRPMADIIAMMIAERDT